MVFNTLAIEIRNCRKCTTPILAIPQPGYFHGKILFIFQNPAVPIPGKWQDDILINEQSDIEKIQTAYLSTIQYSKLGAFINTLNLKWEDISVANLVKCPTYNNTVPTEVCIQSCREYILQQIELLQPKLIILNGALPKQYLYSELKLKYKILCFYHYAYLNRIGKMHEYCKKYSKAIFECM